jgi:hypothetical protein
MKKAHLLKNISHCSLAKEFYMKKAHLLKNISTIGIVALAIVAYSHRAKAAGVCGVPRIDCDTNQIEPANKIYIPESQVTNLTSDLANMTNYALSTDTRMSNARTPTGSIYAGSNIYFTTGTSTSTATVAALANSPVINSSGGSGSSWTVAYEQDFTTLTSTSTVTQTATYTLTDSSTATTTMTEIGAGNVTIGGVAAHIMGDAWQSHLGIGIRAMSGTFLYSCLWTSPTVWWRFSNISAYLSEIFTSDIAVEFMLHRDSPPDAEWEKMVAGIQVPYADETTSHDGVTGMANTMHFSISNQYSGNYTYASWVSCNASAQGSESVMNGSGPTPQNIFAFEIVGPLLIAHSSSNSSSPNNWMPWANNTFRGTGLAKLLGTRNSYNGDITGTTSTNGAGYGYKDWGVFVSYDPESGNGSYKTIWLQKMRIRYKQNGL